MKVIIPNIPKFVKVFEGLPSIFTRRIMKDRVEIDFPLGYEINREFCGFKQREFVSFFREIEVKDGKKIRRGDIIILEPKKDSRLSIRISFSEKKLIEEAARKRGKRLVEYCRAAIFTQMTRDLNL